MWLTHNQLGCWRGVDLRGSGVVLLLSAAVKFCESRAQTLFTSYADHMFTGINLGPESEFRIYLLCKLGLCYLSRELIIVT